MVLLDSEAPLITYTSRSNRGHDIAGSIIGADYTDISDILILR